MCFKISLATTCKIISFLNPVGWADCVTTDWILKSKTRTVKLGHVGDLMFVFLSNFSFEEFSLSEIDCDCRVIICIKTYFYQLSLF